MTLLGSCIAGLLLGCGAVGAEQSRDHLGHPDFHVAVDGSDDNAGTAAAPFATLPRARDAVRARIRMGLTRDVVVEVHGGTYRIAEPLIFGPEDSGTPEFAIIYAATPGETVVLDGGCEIDGWTRGPGPLWTASVPEARGGAWYPRQLFVDGRRAIRARTPNHGWCEGKPVRPIAHDATGQPVSIRINTVGGKGIFGWAREFEYDQATIAGGVPACPLPGDVELISLRHNEGGRKRLESIDVAAAIVTLRPPHRWAPTCYGNDWFNGVPDGRCYLENAAEFLDAPGEWYLDRSTGVCSYWPRPGEDPGQCRVVAPRVQGTLLSVAGTTDRPVVNLHFRGLHVAHVDWLLPPEGYAGLFCCNVPVFREEGDPGHRFIEAAVEMTHARSCSFRDGGVARVGGMGIVLGEGTADVTVEGNEVGNTGAGGIGLGQCNVGFGYLKAAPPARPGEYEGFRIRNNHVHHCGLDYFGAVGIAIFRLKDSDISHNLIHDTAYCGVVFPGDQDPAWSFVGGNTCERNHIFRDMQVTQDGAGLYASFAHRGTLVRANLIHDSSGRPMSGGICLDGCTGMTFDHNVVYRNPAWSLVLFRPVDLAGNAWTGNLVMPARARGESASVPTTLFDGRPGWKLRLGMSPPAPPREFLEVMTAYAGLEPAYRRRLEGVAPRPCVLHVLADGLSWQLDLPGEHRGVVWSIDARAGKAAEQRPGESSAGVVRLTHLDAEATYALTAYAGDVVSSPTDSAVEDFTKGPLFPMVHEVRVASVPGVPESAMGEALMSRGLPVAGSSTARWVAYRRMR
ncbi:MAG: right-handed parallel beta-helix repeat-containing protein [Planctomycetota bacterium]